MAKGRALTPKQRRFVEEYLTDLNATQAAIRAGFSSNRASEIGWQLLQKTTVKRAVQAAMDARSVRTETTADEVVRELRILAFSDITHYAVNDAGKVVISRRAPFWAKRALSSVKQKKKATRRRGTEDLEDIEYDTEIKLWSKPEALKLLAQHLGILKAPELPPLEAVLAALPADVARQLRPLLKQALSGGTGQGGGGGS